MARKHTTDPETERAWLAFWVTVIIVGILSKLISLPDKLQSFIWLPVIFMWLGFICLFTFIDNHTNKTKSQNFQTKNYSPSLHNNDNTYNKEEKSKILKDYISKQTNKIIRDNNLSDIKDKEAARILTINNAKYSPETIADIYNIPITLAKEVEESITIQEEKKVANHITYEGRISTKDKNKLKSILGYKCEACGTDMSAIYGKLGQNYIELHHKVPYSDMNENEARILTDKEFCVLCPNCHRMIHKLPNAGDIDLLTRIIKLNKMV